MDLNDVHRGQIARYAAFFKGKRERVLADREGEKNDFKSDRLSDESALFNASDVEMLIEMYHQMITAHLREELEKTVNLSAVYMAQLLGQAQQYGMALQVEDISVVEDQNLGGQISALTSLQAAPPLAPKPRATLPTLGGVFNNDPALCQELQELKEQQRQVMDRNQMMQAEMSGLLRERSSLADELEKVKANTKQLMLRMHEMPNQMDPSQQMATAQIEQSLNMVSATLQEKQAECEAMRHDLNQRLGDSAQFRDLKAIVKKKSQENRELRACLIQHGLLAADQGCVELEADSD